MIIPAEKETFLFRREIYMLKNGFETELADISFSGSVSEQSVHR